MNSKEFPAESEEMDGMASCCSDEKTSIRVNPAESEIYAFFKCCNTQKYNAETAVAGISLLFAGLESG